MARKLNSRTRTLKSRDFKPHASLSITSAVLLMTLSVRTMYSRRGLRSQRTSGAFRRTRSLNMRGEGFLLKLSTSADA